VTDDVRDEIAFGAVLDAEVAILEDLAQAREPFRILGEVVNKIPMSRGPVVR